LPQVFEIVRDIVAGLRLRRQGEKWIPCRLCLTADIALRLGLYFGMGPCFWINLKIAFIPAPSFILVHV
jgi:hypothetical protein